MPSTTSRLLDAWISHNTVLGMRTYLISRERQEAVRYAMCIHHRQDIIQAFGVPLRRANEICTT